VPTSRFWLPALAAVLLVSRLDIGWVQESQWHDPSPHRVLSVEVAPDLKLEVLDWGGAGAAKPDYGGISVPALAIYAVPRSEEDVPGFGTASQSVVHDLFQVMKDEERTNSAAFRSAVREARVIEIPGAKHLLFLSNEEDVLRAIRVFVLNTR
jgi:hypothetical protein